MTADMNNIRHLVDNLPLGQGHEHQERAVAVALQRLLVDRQRGIVLADEVGFGKTYEALAVVSQLCAYARQAHRPFERALVLCKPALVSKWEEETSADRPGRGFPRYLSDNHPARDLFFGNKVRRIDSRATARALRRAGVRGQIVDGRHQVPPGVYIVNERLLQEETRQSSTLLRQLWRTYWDVVIVDEAHHYARGNRPVRLFAPDGDIRNYEQDSLNFGAILALTATPFELAPREMVNLLALIKTDVGVRDVIELGLQSFVRALDRFFELRERSPTDPLRQQQVALLEHLRDHDALNSGASGQGLQPLLRRFLIRNIKKENERRYYLVERSNSAVASAEFRKLDDNLHELIQRSPLIPFDGEHALFYLELRDLLQDVTERARDNQTSRTFIATHLRQGLSSYRQIATSPLLDRNLDSAIRFKQLVHGWDRTGRLHPKVAALAEVLGQIVEAEIRKVSGDSSVWFSKVLIFNRMIRGTAPQLAEVLSKLLTNAFESYLAKLLKPMDITRDELRKKVMQAVSSKINLAERALEADEQLAKWRYVPEEFIQEDFAKHRGWSFLRVFREPLRRRAVQPLALIDLIRNTSGSLNDAVIADWVEQRITSRVVATVRTVIEQHLGEMILQDEEAREAALERAERDLLVELEESKSIGIVGRFDGESGDRESHRRNFNRRYNPFVLLVGQVGEEGIDLQEQCRYVIHYDLEWNPARMEQREGRVDRIGWGRASEGYIDVRFLLLKGTYEERIFHTVMRRDEWFQVLIGSKKRELGAMPETSNDDDDAIAQDEIEEQSSGNALTASEKERVMFDLRPN